MKEKLNYTLVMGYGWSGSSAVVDLIKEIDGFEEAGVEVRVIKDPYGVIDLRSRLAEKWDPLNSDMAIRDFLWLVDRLNGKQSYFSKAGLEYQKYFGDQFLKASYQYIENLIQFGYRGSWWFMDFKMSFGNYFFKRLLRKMKIYDFSQQRKMNFSCLTEQEFDRITQEYMDALFASLIKIDTDHVVIDQALPMHSISLGKNFFRGSAGYLCGFDSRGWVNWQRIGHKP